MFVSRKKTVPVILRYTFTSFLMPTVIAAAKCNFQVILVLFLGMGSLFFFFGMMTPAYGEAEDTVRLTKNPTRSCRFPWYQVHGISFERFPRSWQTVGPGSGPSHCVDLRLAFSEEVQSSSDVMPSLFHLHSHV